MVANEAAAILMNPQTWVASGHLGGFSDPLMDCKSCKERFRADKLIEDFCQGENITLPKPIDAFSQQEMADFIEEKQIPCPTCVLKIAAFDHLLQFMPHDTGGAVPTDSFHLHSLTPYAKYFQ